MTERPIVEVVLVPGTSVLVRTTDGIDFLVCNYDPKFTPKDEPVCLRVIKEEGGEVQRLYETQVDEDTIGDPNYGANAARIQAEGGMFSIAPETIKLPVPEGVEFNNEPVTAEDFQDGSFPTEAVFPASPFGGLSLDQMLAGAINPGNPVAGILASSDNAAAAAAAPPPPPLSALDGSASGASEGVSAATLPPGLRSMDEAPRTGVTVMLQPPLGMDPVAGRWSSAFGRQFWVDEGGDSLGMDNEFVGWRLPTEEEMEEFNL